MIDRTAKILLTARKYLFVTRFTTQGKMMSFISAFLKLGSFFSNRIIDELRKKELCRELKNCVAFP